MAERLAGKVAIITGGTGGIGLATARLFINEGAKVFIIDQKQSAIESAVKALGTNAAGVVADVSQEPHVAHYTSLVVQTFGGFDICVLNAGIEGQIRPIWDYPTDSFDRVMAVNVRGVWLGVKHAIPVIARRGGGSIIITSSLSGNQGARGASPYVASKHAIIGIMKTAALECGHHRVRVNTVNPGVIDTQMIRDLEKAYSPGAPEVTRRNILASIPLQRYGTPEEVENLMLFLASDESTYCTGGEYFVSGGFGAGT
jgi:NAD(P)-dependent dehydrogenase (short-subunit alcohol dehydrogenase family)